MKRVVFMGTPDFSVPSLQALIETQHVVGVVTQPDRPAGRGNQLRHPPVKLAADAAGIPVYQPKSLRKVESLDPIRHWNPDVIVVAAFGQILRPHTLALPEYGCINVHASLLPRWRGAAPIQHAILAGDTETGVCIMQMDVGLDTGATYSCQKVEISADTTAQSLHDELAALGGAMLKRDLPLIFAGRLTPSPQPDAGATYASMIRKEDGALDWSESADAIDRRIRAMTPWPSAFTIFEGMQLKILAGKPIASHRGSHVASGTVIVTDEQEIGVATGDGVLILDRVQLQGKRAMAVDEFVRGRPHFVETILG
jgi:methionyl-tRNA formyltransferase